LYTPPLGTVLDGITRDCIIKLSRDLDLPLKEESISRDQLYISDEVFICGTAAEVVPVREIDHRIIGDGQRGFITKQIQNAYHAAAKGNHSRSDQWLTYLD
jgi:branched-chain amino acid aminotransferase